MTADAASFGTDADIALFRRAMSRFPTGVCVVSTVHRGLDHAMTANAITSVSLDPPLMLVCIERDARFHDAVVEAGNWAVSILDASARRVADWLATRGRPLHAQLSQVPHRRGPATGAALIDAGVAWIECRNHQVVVAGDHSVVIGEVIGCGLGPDDAASLLYSRGRYAHEG